MQSTYFSLAATLLTAPAMAQIPNVEVSTSKPLESREPYYLPDSAHSTCVGKNRGLVDHYNVNIWGIPFNQDDCGNFMDGIENCGAAVSLPYCNHQGDGTGFTMHFNTFWKKGGCVEGMLREIWWTSTDQFKFECWGPGKRDLGAQEAGADQELYKRHEKRHEMTDVARLASRHHNHSSSTTVSSTASSTKSKEKTTGSSTKQTFAALLVVGSRSTSVMTGPSISRPLWDSSITAMSSGARHYGPPIWWSQGLGNGTAPCNGTHTQFHNGTTTPPTTSTSTHKHKSSSTSKSTSSSKNSTATTTLTSTSTASAGGNRSNATTIKAMSMAAHADVMSHAVGGSLSMVFLFCMTLLL